MARNVVLRPGSKIEKLYNYLKSEMIGTELLFTIENARHLMGVLEVKKPEAVWTMLILLEKRGLIIREKRNGQKGLVIAFGKKEVKTTEQKPEPKQKRKYTKSGRFKNAQSTISLDELIEKLKSEIQDLKKLLSSRVKTYETLVAARAELKKG